MKLQFRCAFPIYVIESRKEKLARITGMAASILKFMISNLFTVLRPVDVIHRMMTQISTGPKKSAKKGAQRNDVCGVKRQMVRRWILVQKS